MKKKFSIKVKRNLIKRLNLSLLIALYFTFSDVYAYSDVPKGHWAEKYIESLTEKGIIQGIGDDKFGMGQPVKYSEFGSMLAKVTGISAFPHISDGYITREDAAGNIVAQIISYLNYGDLYKYIDSKNSPFSDTDKGFITMAYDLGIISGKGNNTFLPNDTLSREEAAVIIHRLYEKYNSKIDFIHSFYAISSWAQRDLAAKTNCVSFGWGRLEYDDTKGVVLNTTSENNNDWKIPDGSDEALNYFKEKNIPISLAVIMNTEQKGENGENACRTILLSDENRKKAVEGIISASSDFNGVTIDFEGMKGDELRNGLNLFLNELRQNLPPEKFIYTAVHPVMSGEYFNGYDYKTIGKISDMVIIMAHDYGASSMNEEERNAGFTTTPVTPFNQIYTALKEASSQIDDKNKISLALSLASTSCWTLDENGKVTNEYSEHPSQETVEKRLSQPDTVIEYSDKYKNPKAVYTNDKNQKTVLWYENSQSVQDKICLAKMFGINKISIWRIGQITDDIWRTIENMR